jgi:hypothetical protein
VDTSAAFILVQAAGVLLLAAGSALVLHLLKLSEREEAAPPQPAPASLPLPAEDDLRRAA